MKKWLLIVVLVVSGYFLFTLKGNDGSPILSYSPCDNPLTYRIGTIDPRFNLTQEETLSTVKEATALWNNQWKTPIFRYDPKGEILISLDYDERQMLSNQINKIQSHLDTDKNNLDPQVNAFKQRSNLFEKNMQDLNNEIAFWNAKGGAPEETYNKIKSQQAALRIEAEQINAQAASLNQSTKSYNSQIRDLNQTVNQLDKTLITKPEEGIYNPNDKSISIYFNNNHAELTHTIAHELGHARGLEHVADPGSIMYVSSTKITALSPEDISGLHNVCEKRGIAELYWNKYVEFVRGLRSIVQSTISKS